MQLCTHVIGELSSRSARPSGPASTGHECSHVHSRTIGSAQRGWSTGETNVAPGACTTVWAAISEVRSTSARGARGGHAPSLTTSNRSRCTRYGPGRSERLTRTRPRISQVVRTNRTSPPDVINLKVEELVGDRPFANLDDHISQDELRALSDRYKSVAGFSQSEMSK